MLAPNLQAASVVAMLRTASLITLVAPFAALAACDSPGGGGGRAPLDCNATPNVPACQDTRNDTVSGDTTQPDTTQPDTTQPDTTQPDTVGPEDTNPPVDTTPTDTFVPPSCSNGNRRCDGQNAQLCSGGNWTTTETCSGTRVCEDGNCIQTSVCTNNQRRCAGSAVEVCVGGQWQAQSTCPTGCTSGECNPPVTGTDDCETIVACGDNAGCWDNPPSNQACFNQCLANGSTVGKSEASAMISCFDNCSWDATCAYQTCSPQRAACFFTKTGNKTCTQIDDCIGTCASGDNTCVNACYETGSAQAQSRYLWLNACIGLYCEAGDSACYQEIFAAGGPCASAFSDCFP